jgi:SAM-dependent methyltransferase
MNALAAKPYASLAPVYDGTIGGPVFERTRAIFEALVSRFGLRFRDAIDLGCGTGLFCRYLARRWKTPVIGVDLSADMLRAAAKNCRGLPVRLIRCDISRLRLPCRSDLIACNFDTLNHLTSPELARRAIERAADHLRPGGAFFFDFLTPHQRFPPWTEVAIQAPSRECRLTQFLSWNPRRRLLRVKVVIRRRGKPALVERHHERLYEPGEIARWLRRAGLRPVFACDAENAGAPVADLRAPRVVVLAERC